MLYFSILTLKDRMWVVFTFQDTGYTECSISNPLRCEVGDQSGKVGQYDIGGGKRFYTDVNLDLEGRYAGKYRIFPFSLYVVSNGAPSHYCSQVYQNKWSGTTTKDNISIKYMKIDKKWLFQAHIHPSYHFYFEWEVIHEKAVEKR